MASPTIYTLNYDFTAFQSDNPSTPLPADKFEIEFNNIALTTGEIINNLNLLQRSDGSLRDGIVKTENLDTELTIGLRSPTAWVNDQNYIVNDTVIEENRLYRCLEAHESGVFVTDLANNKWVLIADYAAFLLNAEDAKNEAEASAAIAETARDETLAALDTFDDLFLGAKSADPSVDNDGGVLQTGALYFNVVNSSMRVWTGTSWVDAIGGTALPVFVYTASGGETSVSGVDDNGDVLSYVVGKFQLYINGINETRNVTAVDGVSITGIPALSASDVVEIYSFQSVAVLEDIVTHSVSVPTKDDFLLFQDTSENNVDRRNKIENVLLVNGVRSQATQATPSLNDIVLFGDESDNDATKRATLQQILALAGGTPIGTMTAYAGSAAPTGYVLCAGQELNRTAFAGLYAVIGTTYGSGDGVETFNVPDLRGRVVAGKDNMGGVSADRLTDLPGGLNGDNLGDAGGSETHTLATGEMPEHTHDVSGLGTNTTGNHAHGVITSTQGGSGTDVRDLGGNNSINSSSVRTAAAGSHSHAITGSLGTVGSGNAHNNVQPTIIMNWIIKT